MLASVIIPSRGRPNKLLRTIDSVVAMADHPEAIEILVRIDLDDESMSGRLASFAEFNPTFIVGPRYDGYLSGDRFWNEMARLATGEWLVSLNDDAVIESPGWDSRLLTYGGEACVIYPKDNYNHTSFPIISRQVYEALGHVAVFPGIDTWTLAVTKGTDLQRKDDEIIVRHERPDIKGFKHMRDQTWAESTKDEHRLGVDWHTRKDYWLRLAKNHRERLQAELELP